MQRILTMFTHSAIEFLNASSTQDAYTTTLFEALKLTNANCGSIFSHSENTFHRLYSNVPQDKQGIPSPNGLTYKSIKNDKTYVHTQYSLLKYRPDMYEKGLKGIIIIPLRHNSTDIGVLTLQCYDNKKMTKGKLNVLKLFGSIAALGIKKNQEVNHLHQSIANKDLFMSLASHELKNPITTLSMYTQLIRTSLDNEKPLQKKWVDILHTETSQLTEIIDDLLSKKHVSLHEMEYSPQPSDLRTILNDTLEKYQTTHKQRKIIIKDKIKKQKEVKVLADNSKLQQVIVNILNNAVKFSPAHTSLVIVLSDTPTTYDISISDKGTGISKKNIKKLFEKFFKEHASKDGMGLGLYVAKNIIDKHKGKITISSQLKKGTTVKISLPKSST